MPSFSPPLYFFLLFFFLHNYATLGCLESERLALLNFKAAETPNSNSLLTWVADRGSNCCAWQQVRCNPTSGRVVQLALNRTFSHYTFNASMFLPFKELQHLDVSDSNLEGWYRNEGFERLSELKNLEVLNLKENGFNNSIISSLGALTSLKTLDLSFNLLSQEVPEGYAGYARLSGLKKLQFLFLNGNYLSNELVQYLSALSSLETLDLSINGLEGSLSAVSRGLRNMSKLKILNLDRNIFNGTIPPSLLALKTLESLSLGYNRLKDFISGFCELKNLRYLDLRSNMFEGILPPCLKKMISLRMLDFSNNQLSGSIPPLLLSNLKSLEYISLSQNKFHGAFSLPSSIAHKFQLRFLALSDCNLRTSTSDLLNFLHNQYDLRHFDISHNNVHGEFPIWLVGNNTRLQNFLLRNNSFSGQMPFPLNRAADLLSVDLSDNHIQGPIQTNLGDVLSNLRYLNLSKNSLQGALPSSLGKLTSLNVLDLSSNNFSGKLPESLPLGCRALSVLMLSNNKLQGQISPALFNLTEMDTMHLNNNHFTGNLPSNVGFTRLFTLDVSDNLISGGIPTWTSSIRSLTTIVLRKNSFSGTIPIDLCRSTVRYVDFSHNNISGSLPACVMEMIYLNFLYLQGNKLTGLPKAVPPYSGLVTLVLTDNKFSGTIPSWFSSLIYLRALLLNGNRFSGPVPQQLCAPVEMGIMDLSRNMLSGSIPSCFSGLNFGKTQAVDLIYDNVFTYQIPAYGYTDLLGNVVSVTTSIFVEFTVPQEIEFMAKSYKGYNLTVISGLDISNNHFTGRIPRELGALSAIRALSFSHNMLSGPIPKALSNLTRLETMDLSHNKLSGRIPPELTEIRTLSVFTVAYNNLSGPVPDTAQFAGFGEASYEGNPLLCGRVLRRKCIAIKDSSTETHL